jgi:hypothetical protein
MRFVRRFLWRSWDIGYLASDRGAHQRNAQQKHEEGCSAVRVTACQNLLPWNFADGCALPARKTQSAEDPPAAASSLLPPRHLVLAAMPAQPSEIEVAFCDAALRDAGYVVATGGEDVQYPPARCVALLRQEETLLGLDCEEMLLSEYESDCHTDS